MNLTILVLVCYLAVVFGIGLYNGRAGAKNEEDYYLGDRSFGPLPTAISMGATDSSGWIFIGAIGYAYIAGPVSFWMYPGFAVAALLNWLFIGPKLRKESVELGALDLIDYFEKKIHKTTQDTSHTVKVVGAALVVLFFIPYMSSQLTAAGKTIHSLINLDYNAGLIFSAVFVTFYCFWGGYKSVIYTDFMQGSLMLLVFFIFPPILIAKIGGWGAFWAAAQAIDPVMGTLTGGAVGSAAIGVIIGLLFYGIGEFGQPHILQRFFSAKDDNTLKYGTIVSSVWMIGVMCGSSILGCIARVLLDNLNDPEYAFPVLVGQMMPPVVSGIVIGAIFAAVQSTFSSQLLVAVQAVASNIIKPLSKKNYTDAQLVTIGKITMIVLCILSTAIALLDIDSVFSLVVYAWSGLASAFGPLCVLLIYRPHKVNKVSAITGMLVGLTVSTAWYLAGLSAYCMELVPGMLASWAIIELLGGMGTKAERAG